MFPSPLDFSGEQHHFLPRSSRVNVHDIPTAARTGVSHPILHFWRTTQRRRAATALLEGADEGVEGEVHGKKKLRF
jgi:hypothetical protein